MREEYDLNTLKVKRHSPLPRLTNEDAKQAKIRVTIALDEDVVNYFKKAATKPGSLPYQTQINQALRKVIQQPNEAEAIKSSLLKDKDFIREVANKIAHR